MFSRPSLIVMLLFAGFGVAACDASGYRKSSGGWMHGDFRLTPRDAATFKPLDDVFARDALRGYCRGSEVADSEGGSFAVVSEREARDKNNVYFCDTYRKGQEYWLVKHVRVDRIEGADPATYTSIGSGYARDKYRAYADGVAFMVRDPASFEPLGGGFARDAQRGYYARAEIPGSHGPSFETIDTRDTAYVRDRANGYHGHRDIDSLHEPHLPPPDVLRKLDGAEPAAIRVLGLGYAADTRHVWHRGRPLAGADASTFAVDESHQGDTDATDKSGAWQHGKRVVASK